MDSPIILFCDDDALRAVRLWEWQNEADRHRTIWVKTVKEALRVLKEHGDQVEQLHLDHDLDGQEVLPTKSSLAGMEVVRWFENLPKQKREKFLKMAITLHDHNRFAAKEQFKRLTTMGFRVKYIPFGLESEVF